MTIKKLLVALSLSAALSTSVYADTFGQSNDNEAVKNEISASDVLKLEPESMAQRQLQTRKYNTTAEDKIVNTCVNVLQDSGFTIENTELKLGTILASKEREAVESGQVAGAIIIAVIFGVAIPIDKNQKMFASSSADSGKVIDYIVTQINDRINQAITYDKRTFDNIYRDDKTANSFKNSVISNKTLTN
jgi:hypothetical protein